MKEYILFAFIIASIFSFVIYAAIIPEPHQYIYFCSTIKQDKSTYEVIRNFMVITTNYKITTAEEIQSYLQADETFVSFNLLTSD